MALKKSSSKITIDSNSALIILDMLNLFDFPESDELVVSALRISKKIAALKEKCRKKNMPIIYVNDNFGQWRSNWVDLFKKCSENKCKGKDIAIRLRPEADDYFVLKPMHSGFFHTPLELLLRELKVTKLILTGVAGNICVLFTAHDAHMRKFELTIPKDCIASNTEADNNYALHQFKHVLGFKITASDKISL